MSKRFAVLLVVTIVILIWALTALALAIPAHAQEPTETPTPVATSTPPYQIVNTVSLGEYGITIAVASQCLLITLMGLAAFLWAYLQPPRRK
jgi:hypothetical protein